jgi:hypothetical protein
MLFECKENEDLELLIQKMNTSQPNHCLCIDIAAAKDDK